MVGAKYVCFPDGLSDKASDRYKLHNFSLSVSVAMLVRSGQNNPFVITSITGLSSKHLVLSGLSRYNMDRALTHSRHEKSQVRTIFVVHLLSIVTIWIVGFQSSSGNMCCTLTDKH